MSPVQPAGARPDTLVSALAERSRREVRFLRHRLIPQAGVQVDLIAISPAATWVVGVRQVEGDARIVGLGSGEQLWVGGREQTDLVATLDRQLRHVRAAIEQLAPGTPTHGALCLLDAELPIFQTLTVRGIPLCGVEAMATRLNLPGAVDEARAERLLRALILRFPAC